MIIRAFDKDRGKTKIYAFEVSREEIESCPFTEKDQLFFKACAEGSPSKQLLGLSLLARKIEDQQASKIEIKPSKITFPHE